MGAFSNIVKSDDTLRQLADALRAAYAVEHAAHAAFNLAEHADRILARIASIPSETLEGVRIETKAATLRGCDEDTDVLRGCTGRGLSHPGA